MRNVPVASQHTGNLREFVMESNASRISDLPAYIRERIARNALAVVAREEVRMAVRRKDIIPAEACETCGHDFTNFRRHAHHDDYSRPLSVRWLCTRCHHRVHHGPRDVDENVGWTENYHEARAVVIDQFERDYIGDLMETCAGNISLAAKVSGVNRATLYRMLLRHGVTLPPVARQTEG